jgi:hypothetical protein
VLQYDAERHLVQWQSQPSGAQQYTQNAYDSDGDRVWEQATNGSTTTVYLGQLATTSPARIAAG